MRDDKQGNAILDQWHAARAAHKVAPPSQKDAAFADVLNGEAAAIEHFGMGKHMEAYKDRFGDYPYAV
ncbi:hypothetical protein R8871_06058 [Paraburkholderia graminis C4D1M]|jgi:hypothetical protein|uniref:Uncharacterized protein n=1 Tax=Paraburkholderia graminis (strain ATCC 700544 / DSM 17151 / LMG 18924 / NCIMB 13744 / C4D1M) TaxID=396598 RepID=B1G473_PARG4|nr:hypothetical protein [Paraburkholderia graminis]EDT09086.1 hypothetical protein BgramDRAFT_4138 [Paraburkholderia graminis C4D1M]CAB3734487.1 hypothetical protein R8871_06058 [Paraburkholderia graminis C4D1M]